MARLNEVDGKGISGAVDISNIDMESHLRLSGDRKRRLSAQTNPFYDRLVQVAIARLLGGLFAVIPRTPFALCSFLRKPRQAGGGFAWL